MPVANGAQPYRFIHSKKYITMDETVGPKASAAGGWISTAGDLHKFTAALYAHQLIKPQTWEMMKTANSTNPKDSSFRYYAYGLETYINQLIPGVNLYGHNGGGAGFSIDAFIDPATGYIIVSCTNLYQNSRPIMVNYLKAALQKPTAPVERAITVRLYDFIEGKGIDGFVANGKEYLKQFHIEPHPGFFAQMGDAFLAAKDYEKWNKWMDFGISLFPKAAYLWVLQGDGKLQMNDKAAAQKAYEIAKTMAAAANEQWLVNVVNEKLQSL